MVVLGIVAVSALFIIKRKQAAAVTGAAANYPDLDELEDDFDE